MTARDQDDRVEELADRANRRGFWRPGRFIEGVEPVSPSHVVQFAECLVRRSMPASFS